MVDRMPHIKEGFMNASIRGIVPCLLALIATCPCAASPTLNYQGRITAGGGGFTGAGYFKFVLVDEGGRGVWSNDGTGATNEPAASAAVEVNNGLFTIELGNTALPGMAAISALAFHKPGLFLRTWFSTNDATFQQLAPDTPIRSPDFAHLNTGRMIVVDKNGRADFDNLADAVAAVGSDTNYDGILVMPGRYELSAPLSVDANHPILITGIDRGFTKVVNTNGAAFVVNSSCSFSKLDVSGAPAVSGTGAAEVYNIWADNCLFTYWGSGPAFDCHGTGMVMFANNCATWGLALGDAVGIYAENSDFSQGSELNDVQNQPCSFRGCHFSAHFSGTGTALTVRGGSGIRAFVDCVFQGALVFTNIGTIPTYPLAIYRGIHEGDLVFAGCTNPINYEVGDTIIRNGGIKIRDSDGLWWFDNVKVITGPGGTALSVDNVHDDVEFTGCELLAKDGTPVKITVSEAFPHQVIVGFDRSWIINEIHDPGATNDGIVVTVLPPASNIYPMVRILRSVVHGIRYGVYSEGGVIDIENSSVIGQKSAVTCTNSPICQIFNSSLQSGIWPDSPSDIISFTGRGHCNLNMLNTVSSRTGCTSGRGFYAAMGGEGAASVIGSVLVGMGSGAGLECEGGTFDVADSIVVGGYEAPAVLLKYTNTVVAIRATKIKSMDVSNTRDVVVLKGNGAGLTAPSPQIIGCAITAESTNNVRSIGLSGGATTGNVVLVNTVMSKNKRATVGLIAPSNTLSYGNYVYPQLR